MQKQAAVATDEALAGSYLSIKIKGNVSDNTHLIVLPTDGPHRLAYISKDLTKKMHSLTSPIPRIFLSQTDHYWTIFGPSAVTETFLRHISDCVCNLFNLT